MTTQTFEDRSNKGRSKGEWHQWMPGERFAIHTPSEDTNGAYTMIEIVADHRSGTPMHIHLKEDEHFIVLEGTLHIVCGDRALDATAGTAITVNKGVPHAWCNLLKGPLRMLVIFAPGGFEGCFRALIGRPSDEIVPILDRYACRVVGPALLELEPEALGSR